ACALIANAYVAVGDHDRAAHSADRALKIADRLQDTSLHGLARFRRGQANHALGRYTEATRHFDRAATILSGHRMRQQLAMAGFPAALARSASAMCLSETGDFVAALAKANEALQMAEAIDDPFTLTFALTGLGHHAVRMGDFAKAIATLERSLAIAR